MEVEVLQYPQSLLVAPMYSREGGWEVVASLRIIVGQNNNLVKEFRSNLELSLPARLQSRNPKYLYDWGLIEMYTQKNRYKLEMGIHNTGPKTINHRSIAHMTGLHI